MGALAIGGAAQLGALPLLAGFAGAAGAAIYITHHVRTARQRKITFPTVPSVPRVSALDFVLPEAVTDRELEELRRVLFGRKGVSNGELASLMKVQKAEASRRASKGVEAGIITRKRVGKEVSICLASLH